MKGVKVLGLVVCLSALLAVTVEAAERDPLKPRVPASRLEEAKAVQNPTAADVASIQIGKGVFRGRGSCNVCHGESGKGDGIGASGLDPSPRNLTNKKWQDARSDGELMWVFKHGSPGTAMITVVPGLVSEEQAWHLVNYIRSLRED